MHDNISPEERLLRLIRIGPKKPKAAPEPADADKEALEVTAPVKRQPILNINFGRFSLPEDLTTNIFLAVIAVLGLVLLFSFAGTFFNSAEKKVLALSRSVTRRSLDELDARQAVESLIEPQDLTYYAQSVASRNLFSAETAALEESAPRIDVMQRIAKLKLQGIITEPDPQAIIEDQQTNQIYFLSVGGCIGDIELKAILDGKVKVYYSGQEIELGL